MAQQTPNRARRLADIIRSLGDVLGHRLIHCRRGSWDIHRPFA